MDYTWYRLKDSPPVVGTHIVVTTNLDNTFEALYLILNGEIVWRYRGSLAHQEKPLFWRRLEVVGGEPRELILESKLNNT